MVVGSELGEVASYKNEQEMMTIKPVTYYDIFSYDLRRITQDTKPTAWLSSSKEKLPIYLTCLRVLSSGIFPSTCRVRHHVGIDAAWHTSSVRCANPQLGYFRLVVLIFQLQTYQQDISHSSVFPTKHRMPWRVRFALCEGNPFAQSSR